MSTLQLTPEHLSAIIYGMQRHQVIGEMFFESELTEMVKELAKHNLLEIQDTYKNESVDIEEQLYFYEYRRPTNAKAIAPIQFYKLAQSYQYNSSGSPDWEDSKAKRWTDSLMSQAIASLPEYNDAKWTI